MYTSAARSSIQPAPRAASEQRFEEFIAVSSPSNIVDLDYSRMRKLWLEQRRQVSRQKRAMKPIAWISFRGGGTIIPARSPYEREILIEHIDQCAKRYGSVRVELDRETWTIDCKHGVGICSTCHRSTDGVCYKCGSVTLCTRCAQERLRATKAKRTDRRS
jgi:hypothetical protein